MFSKKIIKYAAASTIAVSYGLQFFQRTPIQIHEQKQQTFFFHNNFHTLCDTNTNTNTNLKKECRRSIPNQVERYSKAKKENNERYINIDSVYKYEYVVGKSVLITGGNRGIGWELAKELVDKGAHVIITTRSNTIPANVSEFMKQNVNNNRGSINCLTNIDVTDDHVSDKLIPQLKTLKDLTYIDIVINNAGYFYEKPESILNNTLNMEEELKMIDICALGPLRITNALIHSKYLCTSHDLPLLDVTKENKVDHVIEEITHTPTGCASQSQSPSKIIMITSQGGSIAWRFTQNPSGGDYGHHMSKAAANMMSVLVAQELKATGMNVGILHPGFNKTDMTAKYASIWEVEGAVDASIGAKRVIHEIGMLDTHLYNINNRREERLKRQSKASNNNIINKTNATPNTPNTPNTNTNKKYSYTDYDLISNGDGGYHTAYKHWYIYYSIDGYPYYYNNKTYEWYWVYPNTIDSIGITDDRNVEHITSSSNSSSSSSSNANTNDNNTNTSNTKNSITATISNTPTTITNNNNTRSHVPMSTPFIPDSNTYKNCIFINCEDGKIIPW